MSAVLAVGIRLGCEVPDELVGRSGYVHFGLSLGPACHDAAAAERHA